MSYYDIQIFIGFLTNDKSIVHLNNTMEWNAVEVLKVTDKYIKLVIKV